MDEPPNEIDLEALDLGPMLRHARTATFATNWKSVLAADGLVGVAPIALGIAALFLQTIVGAVLIALGVLYCFLVFRRFLQWRYLRRAAGL